MIGVPKLPGGITFPKQKVLRVQLLAARTASTPRKKDGHKSILHESTTSEAPPFEGPAASLSL